MKKYVIILMLLLIPFIVKANETIINANGVSITSENYLNLQKLYSEKYIDNLTQDEYDYIIGLNLDYDNIQTETKYFRSSYNELTDVTTNEEITEDEYNDDSDIMLTGLFVETTYKRIDLSLAASGSSGYIQITTNWKVVPSTRSYDVIGFRLSNVSVVNGTQGGKQIYISSGTTNTITYAFNGTNIKNLSNGFGISMNLVNNSVSYLECTAYATVRLSSGTRKVYASYQHAVANVSLATSQNYSISAGGLGGVFSFNGTAGNNYDDTQGLYGTL